MKTYPIKYRMLCLVLFLSAQLNYSCKKFVDVSPPNNQIISSLVFTDDRTATATILGLYIQMMNNSNYFISGGLSLYPALSADEIINTVSSSTIDPFRNNQLLSSSTLVATNLWRYGYTFIYQTNACIEGLNNSTNVTATTKNQLIGEAKFIRALCHFYLLNVFGDIPVVTSSDYRINESMPRIKTDIVYDQIVSDLLDAQSLLLPTYPTNEPVRVNKWAATALLARVYLYRKDWINAEAQATAVINSGTYNLVTNLNLVFLADSKEAILQLIPPNGYTVEGLDFTPSSATVIPPYAIRPELLAAFETNDLRKTSWIGTNTIGATTYSYPYKFKVRSGTVKTEYSMLLRLAEQYLIRAEARAQQNKISGSNSAESDLNIIRTRAGLTATPANTQTAMLLAIEKERFTELFTEWGHRWFDLKRTGRVDAVLSTEKIGWVTAAALYPVPYAEIQKNPFLIQNPGYQ